MECQKERNMDFCNCSYEPCSRKGVCCDCIRYHSALKQLPACFFSTQAERTYDRSIRKFVQENS